MADAQGHELRALADTLREAERVDRCGQPHMPYDLCSHPLTEYALVPAANLPTIISALERAADAEGEKAEALPVKQCFLSFSHDPHDWWYTSKKHRCPGKAAS